MADNKTSIIISAVDQTGAAIKSAQSGLEGLQDRAGKVSAAIGGFAALAGVGAFAGIVKGAIDAADELDELSQKSGATVESLSAMKGVAKIAGADMEQVAGGLAKLSKNMVEAAQGSGDAANVFKVLGVSVTDSAGKLKTSDQVMVDFAQRLQLVGNNTEKVAAAQAVLGKSGSQLLPFLNDLAKVGELQAKITTEQAAAAADLNDNLKRLTATHKAWVNTVAMEFVPVADVFVRALLEMAQSANGTKKTVDELARDGVLREWAIGAAKGAGFVVDAFDGVVRVVQLTGRAFAGIAKDVETFVKVATFAAGAGFTEEGQAAIRQALSERQQFIAAMNEDMAAILDRGSFSEALARNIELIGSNSVNSSKGVIDLSGALSALSASGSNAANALEKLRLDQMASITKQAAAELAAIAKQQEDYAKALAAALDPLEKQAAALEREVAYYGMTESAIQEVIIARMEEARAIAEANGAWPEHLNYLDQEIELRKRIASAASQKEYLDTNKRAAEQASRDWEKFSDQLNQSLTDALFRSFESGKGFGQSFIEALRNSFKSTILKLAVQYTINAGGSILGSLGNTALNYALGTGASNGGNGVNYLGIANNASTLNTAYGAAAQYFTGASVGASSASLVYANGVGMAGGDAIGALYAANGGWAGVSTGAAGSSTAAGASGSGLSGGFASLASNPYTWIVAAVMAMFESNKLYNQGVTWDNNYRNQYNGTWAEYLDESARMRELMDMPLRQILGDEFVNSELHQTLSLGSFSAAIHSIFGKHMVGATRQTGSQVSGEFSDAGGGFSGSYGINMKKSGGLFSRSREWTDWYALPEAFDDAMDMTYLAARNSFVMLGSIFEDSTIIEKLKGFSLRFNVASTDFSTVIDSATKALFDAIGAVVTPSIAGLKKDSESWAQTFQRVITETNSVARVMEMMGDKITDVFGKNNLDGVLKASDAFIQLFGTIDTFNASFQAYYSNFYTSLEQSNQAWADLDKLFAKIGIDTMPTTRQQFRALVDAQNLNTESGRAMFKSLMDLQGAFAALTPTLDDVSAAMRALRDTQAGQIGTVLAAQRQQQQEALRTQITSQAAAVALAQGTIDAFTAILGSLGDYRRSLLTTSGLISPEAQYRAARADYEQTAARAKLGDVEAAGRLQTVSDALLVVARTYGTADSYARDLGMVLGNVDATMGVAERQIPIAQQQLTVAQQQLDVLNAVLASMQQGQQPVAVNDFMAASNDWQNWFASTTIGQVTRYAFGTMQRISDSVGLFVDNLGQAFTFNAADTPYTLAGQSSAWQQELIRRYGQWTVPAFAGGGFHAGGLRLVGENGPELEVTGPSNIINGGQSGLLFDNWINMGKEMKALREEVAALREEQRAGNAAIASNTSKTARTLDKFDIDGLPAERVAA